MKPANVANRANKAGITNKHNQSSTMYTSDSSLIDDPRLTISDTEVSLTVTNGETREVYSTNTGDYADSLAIQAVVNTVLK
ncbi:hypothetical protein [Nostoc cycadae]|uniref:Conjugal transfer protein TrbG n=1 Tax=Nostoc cycadae WK-1 TaxID=1861711 RepID=A0A2H6LC80_9NOSO|nr:hypothetical protein [Nostoc cycadae]GBE90844.1 conjugal transfer protein TrbG [Nostoc cycadae WK-1]